MGFKSTNRAMLIAGEEKEIAKAVARSSSELARDLARVQHFAAFAFNSFIAGDGDVDASDLTAIITQFQAQKTMIESLLPVLNAIEAIDDVATPANVPANLAAFIADNSIDLAAYGSRFE